MFIKITALLLVAVVTYVSCIGEPTPYSMDLNDPMVIEAIKAIKHHLGTISDKPREAVKVLDSTRQLVSGFMYRFTIQFHVDAILENCKVGIYSPLPLNSTQVTEGPECTVAEHLVS